MNYVAVCTYCFGRDTLDCPRCHGSRYELCEEDPGGPGRFIRPASRSEYLHHVREATRKQRHAYRSAA